MNHVDLCTLAGMPFVFRDIARQAPSDVVADYEADELSTGDLTEEERAAYIAAFLNERLRKIHDQWWQVYDEERAAGRIPDPSPRGTWEP